jgi:hypothetical protein
MKKSEPKIILNLQLEGQELEQKIKIAMDDYVERVILANLDEAIEKLINKRVDAIISQKGYFGGGLINGQSLSGYVSAKANTVIEETIDRNIKEILSKKLSQILK